MTTAEAVGIAVVAVGLAVWLANMIADRATRRARDDGERERAADEARARWHETLEDVARLRRAEESRRRRRACIETLSQADDPMDAVRPGDMIPVGAEWYGLRWADVDGKRVLVQAHGQMPAEAGGDQSGV